MYVAVVVALLRLALSPLSFLSRKLSQEGKKTSAQCRVCLSAALYDRTNLKRHQNVPDPTSPTPQ